MIIVKADQKIGKVPLVLSLDRIDQRFRANTQLFRLEHNGGSVSIVSADVVTFVSPGFLKANPYIGLDIFDQMTKMNGAVGVG